MAGTFVHLRFGPSGCSPAELVARLHALCHGRFTERAVARLEWPPVHGMSGEDWALAGCQPGDFGLTPADASDEVLRRSRTENLSASQVLSRWPLDAWHGLVVELDVPPGFAGHPAIHGTLHVALWLVAGKWQLEAQLEYPTRSVRDDPRWRGWLDALVADAAAAFETECVVDPARA